MGKAFRVGGLVVGAVLLAAGALALGLHYYPSTGNLTIYPTSAVPLAVLGTCAAVLVFASMRSWVLAAVSVVVAGGLLVTQLPLWRAAPVPAADAPTITVVSSNLLMGAADIGGLARIIAEANPDILSLQEVTPQAWRRVQASPIAVALPNAFAVPGPGSSGTALLTRGPQRDPQRLAGMVLHNLSTQTDLPGAAGTRVLAVHSGAPVPGAGYGELAVKDTGVLRRHLQELPRVRVIAVGDFNATWDHEHYRELLTGGIEDATDQSGAGWLPTYPTDRIGARPLVAIDHVISRGFVATSMRTLTLAGADHRVLLVRLVPR